MAIICPAKTIRWLLDGNKLRNQTVVTTNGCFDILHVGHVEILQTAAKMGDVLIVGINSDASVKRLKGEGRPFNDEHERAFVIASLECVDYVTIFEEDTPIGLLSILKPDIHVKGGDYKLEDLPERDVVEANGGRIEIVPFVSKVSTTDLIERIKEAEKERDIVAMAIEKLRDTTEADMSGIRKIMTIALAYIKEGKSDSAVRAIHNHLGLSVELSLGIVEGLIDMLPDD